MKSFSSVLDKYEFDFSSERKSNDSNPNLSVANFEI